MLNNLKVALSNYIIDYGIKNNENFIGNKIIPGKTA